MFVRVVLVCALLSLTACSSALQQALAPTISPAASAIVAAAPAATASATPIPPSATSQPTVTPAPPTPTSIPPSATSQPTATPIPPTPTPDPVAGLTIPDLRARRFGEGEITIGEVWQRGPGYTSYRISYPADGLRLTGLLHVPDGDGPFPVIIAGHG
jgi:hypothetical protein